MGVCSLLTTYHVLLPTHQAGTRTAQPCNVYVFCPTRPSDGGLCWSNDVWNHSYGECWLKHQADPSRPEAGAYGAYPAGYRRKHRTAPEQVQWMSGLLPTGLLATCHSLLTAYNYLLATYALLRAACYLLATHPSRSVHQLLTTLTNGCLPIASRSRCSG